MNILYFLDKFPKLSESFISNEILQLEKEGHNVFVFAWEDPNEDIEHLEIDKITSKVSYNEEVELCGLSEQAARAVNGKLIAEQNLAISQEKHLRVLKSALRCRKFLKELEVNVELVHTHFGQWKRYSAVYISNILDCPITITTHAFDLYRDRSNNILTNLFLNTDEVITISDYNANYIENNFYPDVDINTVKNGIDTKKFHPSKKNKNKRILTVSRFVEKKGIDDAIEAISYLIEEHPDVDYRIVGSGKLRQSIQKKINNHGLENNVELLGNISDHKLLKEYDEASYFLLPCKIASDGDRDGIPVSLMESMSMETIPVTTNVSGIPELVKNGKNGVTVEPESPGELSKEIDNLLKNDNLRIKIRSKARETVVEEFTLNNQVNKLSSVFRNVVEDYEVNN